MDATAFLCAIAVKVVQYGHLVPDGVRLAWWELASFTKKQRKEKSDHVTTIFFSLFLRDFLSRDRIARALLKFR